MAYELIPRQPIVAIIERELARIEPDAQGGGQLGVLAARLAAAGDMSEESWQRALYRIRTGIERRRDGTTYVIESIRFETADRLLTALDLTELWFTELADIVPAIEPVTDYPTCEDCGKACLDEDYRPLDLMRRDPNAREGIVWDSTKRRWCHRPRNAAAGGRRFRVVDLCRRCAAEALRRRAQPGTKPKMHKGGMGTAPRYGTVMEGGKRRHLRPTERLAPKRGGRPPLLTNDELRAAHVVYEQECVSRAEVARRLSEQKGISAKRLDQSLLYGWRRLGLRILGAGEGIRRTAALRGSWSQPPPKCSQAGCQQFGSLATGRCSRHPEPVA